MALASGLLLLQARVPRISSLPGGPLLVAWLAVNLASSLCFAPVLQISIRGLLLLLAGAITLAVIPCLAARSEMPVLPAYLNFWLLAIAVGIVGTAVDTFRGTALFSEQYFDVVLYRRTRGTFYEPNFYGIASMMLGVISLDAWLSSESVRRRQPVPWRALMCAIGVVISGTRSAQAAFAIGTLLTLVSHGHLTSLRRRDTARATAIRVALLALLTFAAGILVLAGGAGNPYVRRLIVSLQDPGSSSSLVGRLSQARAALTQVSTHFVLGYGTNTYGQLNPRMDAAGRPIYGALGASLFSLPLTLLYDTGILGFSLAAAWLAVHHMAAFRAVGGRGTDYLWSFSLASVLMFATFVTTNGMMLSFPWVHMGMTVFLIWQARHKNYG